MQALMSDQSVETRLLFCPRFFCPQAFRLVANKEWTALHEMERVCTTLASEADRSSVVLEGPLAILDRCDDPAKKLKGNLLHAFWRVGRGFKECNLPDLLIATEHINRKLRINYDDFDHPSPVDCVLCGYNIGSVWSLLRHIGSSAHRDKVFSLGTSIDMKAYWYWIHLISKT
ncbi:hypothetical protein PENTCL1PPCAC_8045, partial [Pristionchus entomophagus]